MRAEKFWLDSDENESKILDAVEERRGKPCAECGTRLGGEDLIYSIALGFKDAPRCLPRLATGLNRPESELQSDLAGYVRRQECYRRAWNAVATWPITDRKSRCQHPREQPSLNSHEKVPTERIDWDAGDMSCGDLVLALRKKMIDLAPSGFVRLISRDPAAPEDLPAWCRLTGHRLVSASHPQYVIQKKEQ